MARRPTRRPFHVRFAPLLLAGVAVLVVVGLRSDDDLGFDIGDQIDEVDRDDDATGRSTTSTSSGDTPVTATLPSTTVGEFVDDPDDVPDSLREAQLTVGDLPDGWRAAPPGDDSIEVCPGEDPAAAAEPEHALKAAFTGGEAGQGLTSVVLEFDGDDEADGYLDALEDALEACDGRVDPRGFTYTFERTQDVDLGDRSVTANQRIEAAEAAVQGRVLAVRVDDRVVLVAFSSTEDADASVAVEALEAVVGRLEG